MSEWMIVSLGEAADIVTGFPFPSKDYSVSPSDVRLVRGDNVVQKALRWDGVKLWPRHKVDELDSYWLRPGDVVLAMDRPWIEAGLKLARITESDTPSLLVQRVMRLRGGDDLRSDYLYYVLASPEFTQFILSIQTGTAVPHISGPDVKRFELPLPPLPVQREIAHILGTLDDKIDLNRKMNATLEAMARALFKSWFVDFDPVRARAEGRDPAGMDAETAALFPAGFEDSPLGDIPRGWRVGALGNLAAERNERNRNDEFSRVVSAISSGELVLSEQFFNKRVASEDLTKYKKVFPFDFAYNPSRINIGSIGMLKNFDHGLVSPVYVVATPTEDYQWFLEFVIRGPQFKAHVDILASGTVRQNLSYRDFASISVVVPPQDVVRAFNGQYSVLRDVMESNVAQSETLAEMRDALLPRLMRGELVGV